MTDDLGATLRALVERFERLGIEYMVVGSVAALAHGRSRSTQDFDVVVALDERTLRALLASLPPEHFYVSPEAAAEALRRRTLFNVVDIVTGWKVDIVPLKPRAFSQREFEPAPRSGSSEQPGEGSPKGDCTLEFQRRRTMSLLGIELCVASVEDTIVAKLEWSRRGGGPARQREDVRELLALHAGRLDRAYLEAAVRELGLEHELEAVSDGQPSDEPSA